MTDPTPILEAASPVYDRPDYVDLDCASEARVARYSALVHLHRAGRYIARLTDALRAYPDFDEAANEAIRLLNIELEGAGEKLVRFRQLRECVGSA